MENKAPVLSEAVLRQGGNLKVGAWGLKPLKDGVGSKQRMRRLLRDQTKRRPVKCRLIECPGQDLNYREMP
jgi:hypothetical protein